MESETEKIYIQSGEVYWCLKVKKTILAEYCKQRTKDMTGSEQMALITKISGEMNHLPTKE